jgi:heterodisulfide reductase subunit A-like polyferredoxin
MISINVEKCIGCGICAQDCQCSDIKIIEGKAQPLFKSCLNCGHCIAVCPQNAVSIDGYDMNEVIDLARMNFMLSRKMY